MGSVARPAALLDRDHPSEPSRLSAQVSPEDVFLLWLLRLPEGADIVEAARDEIARLDRLAPLPPGPARLRALMAEAAEAGSPRVARRYR